MKTKTHEVPPELTIAEQRRELADALGFLLAQALLREHGLAATNPQPSGKPGDPQEEQPLKPP